VHVLLPLAATNSPPMLDLMLDLTFKLVTNTANVPYRWLSSRTSVATLVR